MHILIVINFAIWYGFLSYRCFFMCKNRNLIIVQKIGMKNFLYFNTRISFLWSQLLVCIASLYDSQININKKKTKTQHRREN